MKKPIMEVHHEFKISKNYFNPFIVEMALSLWELEKPLIYLNENDEMVKRTWDGKTENISKTENKVEDEKPIYKEFDKRYEKPFEDDGAYAD